jgi:hypothetical protein
MPVAALSTIFLVQNVRLSDRFIPKRGHPHPYVDLLFFRFFEF